MADDSKSCIACSEQIKVAAKLCKHCGTMQDDKRFAIPHLENGQEVGPELPSLGPESSSPESAVSGINHRGMSEIKVSSGVSVDKIISTQTIPVNRTSTSSRGLLWGLVGMAVLVFAVFFATGIIGVSPPNNVDMTGGGSSNTDSGVGETNSGHNEERCKQVYVANPNADQYGMIGDQIAQGTWEQQCHLVWVSDN